MTSLSMETIGEVKRTPATVWEFEWKIPRFALLSIEGSGCYRSLPSEVFGESCYLCIYPKGLRSNSPYTTQTDTLGYVVIGFGITSNSPSIGLEVSFAIRNANGNKSQERHTPCQMLFGTCLEYLDTCYISRAELLERASELMPSNILTVICTVRKPETADGESMISKCMYCRLPSDAKAISFHETKCAFRLVRCPECSEVVPLWCWIYHGCQSREKAGEESLRQDLKKMLLEGENRDLIIKVGDKAFPVHRDILSCRSRVFASMLKHDMEEKHSRVINVPDCDPQAMEVSLFYIYTGKAEALDQSNMFGVYYIADKYDVQSLRKESVDYIKKSLSITNICEVFELALKHSEGSLLECAEEYFMNNALDIMPTVKWTFFLKDNTTYASELIVKYCKKMRNGTSF